MKKLLEKVLKKRELKDKHGIPYKIISESEGKNRATRRGLARIFRGRSDGGIKNVPWYAMPPHSTQRERRARQVERQQAASHKRALERRAKAKAI